MPSQSSVQYAGAGESVQNPQTMLARVWQEIHAETKPYRGEKTRRSSNQRITIVLEPFAQHDTTVSYSDDAKRGLWRQGTSALRCLKRGSEVPPAARTLAVSLGREEDSTVRSDGHVRRLFRQPCCHARTKPPRGNAPETLGLDIACPRRAGRDLGEIIKDRLIEQLLLDLGTDYPIRCCCLSVSVFRAFRRTARTALLRLRLTRSQVAVAQDVH